MTQVYVPGEGFRVLTKKEIAQRMREARKREKEEREAFARSMAVIDHASSHPTPQVEAFMHRSRNKRRITVLERQLATARKRGFAKTSVDLDTLQWLLDWREADVV